MNHRLKRETTKLRKSWMQYEEGMLRDYLVEQVEDPRLNVQSILSRHFLLERLFGQRFAALKNEELRFAITINWLAKLFEKGFYREDAQAVLHALSKGADKTAGVDIPYFVSSIFAGLPTTADGVPVPNYLREVLSEAQLQSGKSVLTEQRKATFQMLWRKLLARRRPKAVSVLEPACGSANDYRFLDAFGLARLIDYTGFDLCEKNVRNARQLFPKARFESGNAFAIDSRDQAFDFCFVHDLFEHLSLEGMEAAIAELCRVTRKAICANFFNMAEVDEHVVRPADDYHWNTLSAARTREAFARRASAVQVIHIGTFLRWSCHCAETHNDGAYTLIITL